MHGFALNVDRDLTAFQHITPCGIAGVEMTQCRAGDRRPMRPREMGEIVAANFRSVFGY